MREGWERFACQARKKDLNREKLMFHKRGGVLLSGRVIQEKLILGRGGRDKNGGEGNVRGGGEIGKKKRKGKGPSTVASWGGGGGGGGQVFGGNSEKGKERTARFLGPKNKSVVVFLPGIRNEDKREQRFTSAQKEETVNQEGNQRREELASVVLT